MAPSKKEGSSARRKSIGFLSRAGLTGLTQITTDPRPVSPAPNASRDKTQSNGESEKRKKLSKRNSMFGLGPPPSTQQQQQQQQKDGMLSPVERSSSPKPRNRTLQKGRPSSIFGSLGRRSVNLDNEETDILASTPESPVDDAVTPPSEHQGRGMGKTVLIHGEVQTSTGLFKKKKEYLVLTDTHLIRFKSQARAHEAFSSIPAAYGRSTSTRHPSTASIGSLQEAQSTHSLESSSARENRIPLRQIVTAYKLEDGRPFFTTEVVFLDEEYHGVGSVQLMLHDPKDADLWHTSIRAGAEKERLLMPNPYPQRVIQYVTSVLETALDYDPDHFNVFRVVRRIAPPKGNKSSSDDLAKLGGSVYYMAIGINRLHMIPIPDFSAPQRLSSPKSKRESFGIVDLTGINVQHTDDRFDLTFRSPMHPAKVIELAAAGNPDIASFICKASTYLKPQWIDSSFSFGGPRSVVESVDMYQDQQPVDPFGHFDRTLIAFCWAYNISPSNIIYSVDYLEEGPEWRLHNPAVTPKYSTYELLAIMRSLRYNEEFTSISFRDINLHSLHNVIDKHEMSNQIFTTRSGIPITKFFGISPAGQSLLYQEVQALALKSRRLKKMDFTNTLPRRRPKDNFDVEPETEGQSHAKDPGCDIVAALFPICRYELTNVDWIILNGIELGETDFEFLVPGLSTSKSQIRGIECSRCALNDRLLQTLINSVARQYATLQYFDVSDNPGRINVVEFKDHVKRFTRIRKLDLSRTPRSKNDESVLAPEILRTWRLKELNLNGVPMNSKTLDTILAYLTSEASDELEMLQLEQCNLTGSDVALIMVAMTREAGFARPLQLKVSANRLEKDVAEVVKAVAENQTPSHLVMRMIEFSKEDHFRHLVEALRTNTTVQALDISKASLPYDASDETCDALKALFAENDTLMDLDISGEQSHLEVTRFGIGLNDSLTGLKNNKTLRVLRIEYQNLGLAGANTLASVLEENNSLTQIYCEHNDISLQGFTTLVNAIANNFTVQELPTMANDRSLAIKRMSTTAKEAKNGSRDGSKASHNMPTSVRRTLNSLRATRNTKPDITSQDVDAAVRIMEERWDMQARRLDAFLKRNRKLARGTSDGYDSDEHVFEEYLRPNTAMSDRGILEQVLNSTTPRIELTDPIEDHDEGSKKIPTVSLSHVDSKGQENEKLNGGDISAGRLSNKSSDSFLPELELGQEKMSFDDAGSGLFQMEN